MVIKEYFNYINELFLEMVDKETANIDSAAEIIADSMSKEGKFYVFGTGHSHMIAEELYLRAGGLMNVEAILPPELMLHELPHKSTMIERLEGYSEGLLSLYDIKDTDVFFIISNSGRNSVPVEMAMKVKEKGCKLIVMSSMSHSQSVTSRHSSGKKLYEFADVIIDNHAPLGDAGFNIETVKSPVGPVSDFLGISIAQALSVAITQKLVDKNIQPPVFISANVDKI